MTADSIAVSLLRQPSGVARLLRISTREHFAEVIEFFKPLLRAIRDPKRRVKMWKGSEAPAPFVPYSNARHACCYFR